MWGRTHNSRVACWCGRLNIVRATGLAILCTALFTHTARAQSETQFGWREVWAGTDASHDVWLLYTGVTIAPWSKDIYSDGIRFRAASGYGRYEYEDLRMEVLPCGDQVKLPKRVPCRTVRQRFKADISYSDALIGYHQRFGELTAKAFIGLAVVNHAIHPGDHDNKASGLEYGVKGAIELWLNVGPNAWTSVDLSYTTAHATGAARWRAGLRTLPTFSIGPEVRFDSNEQDHAGRAGVFARYEWKGGEISVAAGAAGNMTGGIAKGLEPYATLNVLFQY